MKKQLQFLKEEKYVIGGFALPLLFMIFICMIMQITPFGEFTFLISDLNGVYIDGFTALRRIVLEGGSLTNTWAQLQGSTPLGFLSTGILFSVFNVLIFIFPQDAILDALTWMIIFKIASCGLTFAIYLKRVFKRNDLSISIFAWCYALMAYNMTYHFQVIWLDQVMMLPLVLYGVEKILRNKREGGMFIATLVYIFLNNYYIAYMIGIFSFIYFLYRYSILNDKFEAKDFLGKVKTFILSPVVAFGCSAFLLLPIIYLLMFRGGIFSIDQLTPYLRYDFQMLFSKFLIGTYDTILPGGTPLVYCGIGCIAFVLYFFVSFSITYKEKLLTFLFLVFMLLSMTFNPLYMAWHSFESPTYFEGRFTFLVSFLIIIIAYKGFKVIQTVSLKSGHIIYGILSGFVIIIGNKKYNFVQDDVVLLTMVFLLLYYLLFVLINKKKEYKKYHLVLLALLIGAEVGNNGRMLFVKMDQIVPFTLADDYYMMYGTLRKNTQKILNEDKDFYRIESTQKRAMNDGFGVGFPGIAHFDTVYNETNLNLMENLGMRVGHNWIAYGGNTPIMDMLCNIKYVMSTYEKYNGYTELDSMQENLNVFMNPYNVGVGFMISSEIDHNLLLNEEGLLHKPFTLQNQLLNNLLQEDNMDYLILVKATSTKEENLGFVEEKKEGYTIKHYYKKDVRQKSTIDYILNNKVEGPCYIYIQSENYAYSDIIVNDKPLELEFMNNKAIVYLGDYKKDEEIHVQIDLKEEYFDLVDVFFCNVNQEALKMISEELSKYALNVQEYTSNTIRGTIRVPNNKTLLYMGIPYDKGWKLYVDGEKYPIQSVYGGFLGATLKPGEYTIRLLYQPIGLRLGSIISIGTWGIIVLLTVSKIKKSKKSKNNSKKAK